MAKSSKKAGGVTLDHTIVDVPLDELKMFHKNPRKGNVAAIAESLFATGQFRPILVQRSTMEILAGNHTWMGANELHSIATGHTAKPAWLEKAERKLKRKVEPMPTIAAVFIDCDDKTAERIVVADNRTSDLGGYDASILRDLLEDIGDATGTGYSSEELDLIVGVADTQVEEIKQVFEKMEEERADSKFDISSILEAAGSSDAATNGPSSDPGFGFDADDEASGEPMTKEFDEHLAEIQGILSLKDDMVFKSSNWWGVPELRSDMLVTSVPEMLDTWGGHDATPDDGQTTWLWNYGACSSKGLPYDRAILCFFTYDEKFDNFWFYPSFQTAKCLNSGVKQAVVPDFSFYDHLNRVEMLFNVHKGQWLGRYFQEAGIRVAPRIQFSLTDPEVSQFNLLGIPKNAPVVFTSQQNMENEEHEKLVAKTLDEQAAKLECETLVIYGGNPAKRVMERMKVKDVKLRHLMNVAGKRRGVAYGKKEGMQATGLKKLKKGRSGTRDEDAGEE